MAAQHVVLRHVIFALLLSAPFANSQQGGRLGEPLIPGPRQSIPLFLSQDAPVWSNVNNAEIVTAPCPDVAHCSEVCVGLDNSGRTVHPSHCTSFNGHGTYTARCCVGTGNVCRQPPCSGNPTRGPAEGRAVGALPASAPAALHHLFSSLPLLPSHTGGDTPMRPSVFQEPVERNADPNERECSQLIVVQLKESRRSSGLRDEVLFNGVNCYQVKVPASTVALKFGIRALSGRSSASLPPVYSSALGWPKGLKLEQLSFSADDDDVAYAEPIDLHGSDTLYLKLRGRSIAPLDYQLWFVQVSAGQQAGATHADEGAWYGWAEALALDPRSRLALGVYLVLGAVVGLSLSQRTVQVRPKALPVAYIIWLTFGALAGHRFYLNRTATGIIWYFLIVALSLGLALDFTFIHSGWSKYMHHHLLWAALLGVTVGGMGLDLFLIPKMAKHTTYWERSQPSKRRRKANRYRQPEGEAGEREDVEEGAVELGTRGICSSSSLPSAAHALPHSDLLPARGGQAGGAAISVRGTRHGFSEGIRSLRAQLTQEAPLTDPPASGSPPAESMVVGEVVDAEEERQQ